MVAAASGITDAATNDFVVDATDTWVMDTTNPISSVDTLAADYLLTENPLTVTATASDVGGTGVEHVELWYRFDNGSGYTAYAQFGSDDTGAPYSWSFTFPDGQGRYQFYSMAVDVATNHETAPGAADTTTVYDTADPVSSVNALAADYLLAENPVAVTVTASDVNGSVPVSGLAYVQLWYRYNNGSGFGGWTQFAGDDAAAPYSWNFTFPSGQGTYEFYSIAVDNAGNDETAPGSADTSTIYDTADPVSSVNALAADYLLAENPVAVTVSATDVNGIVPVSGVAYAQLWYRYNNGSGFGGWTQFAGDDAAAPYSWNFTFPSGQGTYEFRSIAVDTAGNDETAPGSADTTTIYDTTNPSSAVTTSGNYNAASWAAAGTEIDGSATDVNGIVPSSDVASVGITLQRMIDSKYWDGNSWEVGSTVLPAVYVDAGGYTGAWTYDFNPAVDDENGSGTYEVYSVAVDNAGNIGSASGNIFQYWQTDADGNVIVDSIHTGDDYTPLGQEVTINFSNVGTGGQMAVGYTAGSLTNPTTFTGIPGSWVITSEASGITYTITFNYPDMDNDGIVDGTTLSEAQIVPYYYDAGTSTWLPLEGTITRDTTANWVRAAGVTHFTEFTLGSALAVTATDLTPDWATESQSNVQMMRLNFTNSGAVAETVTSVTIASANDIDSDTSIVTLWEDNGDAVFNSGTDTALGTPAGFVAGVKTYGSLTVSIAAGATEYMFVTYTTAGTIVTGRMLDARINTGGITLASGATTTGGLDPAGYTTVDGDAPAVPVIESVDSNVASPGFGNDSTPAVVVSGLAIGDVVRVYDAATEVASGTATGATLTLTTSILSEDSHSLTARSTDAAGNSSSASTAFVYTYDGTAPVWDLEINPLVYTSPTNNTMPTIGWDDVTDAVKYQVNLDGVGWMSIGATSSYTFPIALDDATYTLGVRAVDAAGNASDPAALATITVDTIHPNVDLTYSLNRAVSDADTLVILATFDETPAGTPLIAIDTTGTDLSAVGMTATGNPMAWTYAYTVPAGSDDTAVVVITNGADAATNANNVATHNAFTIDNIAPAGQSVLINNGVAYSAVAEVELTLAAVSAANMSFSNDGMNYSAPQAYASQAAWTLSAGDGSKTVYVVFSDEAGNISTDQEQIILDMTNPVGSAVINGGAEYTNSGTVTVAYTIADTNIHTTPVAFSNDNTTWTAYEASGTPKTWTLSAGDGEKTVYMQIRDLAGQISVVSDTIVRDSTAPVSSITDTSSSWDRVTDHNGNNSHLEATLVYTASDVGGSGVESVDVYYSLDYLDDVAVPTWYHQTLTSNPNTLPVISLVNGSGNYLGDGEYCFYTVATDNVGNDELPPDGTEVLADGCDWAVMMDTTAPYFTVEPTADEGTSSSDYTSGDITITWSATDTLSGLDGQFLSIDWNTESAQTSPYVIEADTLSTGEHMVYVNLRDDVGNWYGDYVNVYFDNSGPSGSLSINDSAAWTTSQTVTLDYSLSDSESGLHATPVAFSNDGTTWTSYESNSGTKSWTLTAGDGTKTVYMQMRDALGNVSQTTDTIILDTTAPASAAVSPAYGNQNMMYIDFATADAGSGVAYTDMYVKVVGPGYSSGWKLLNNADYRSTDLAGTFEYTPWSGPNTYFIYYFATRSCDNAGNCEAVPTLTGDSTTIRDTTAPNPQLVRVSSSVTLTPAAPLPGVATTGTFTLTNYDSADITIPALVLAVRQSGVNYDFGTMYNISIPAGTSYVYSATRSFAASQITEVLSAYPAFLYPETPGTWYAPDLADPNKIYADASVVATREFIVMAPTGTLVKGSTARVYKVDTGVVHPIPSALIFISNGWSWGSIVTISDAALAYYSVGADIAYNVHYRDGAIIKASGPEIYKVENGAKRWFSSWALYVISGYTVADITGISDEENSYIPAGADMVFTPRADGTIMKGSSPEVFLIEGGLKRSFPSAEIFYSNGFTWGPLVVVSDLELPLYTTGAPMTYNVNYRNGQAVKASGPAVYLVEAGTRRWIPDMATFAVIGLPMTGISDLELSYIPAGADIPSVL